MKLSDCKSLKDIEEFMACPIVYFIQADDLCQTEPEVHIFCVDDESKQFIMQSPIHGKIKEAFTTNEEGVEALIEARKKTLMDKYNDLAAQRNRISKQMEAVEEQIRRL